MQGFCLIYCLVLEVLKALLHRLNHYPHPLFTDKETLRHTESTCHLTVLKAVSECQTCVLTLKPNLIKDNAADSMLQLCKGILARTSAKY